MYNSKIIPVNCQEYGDKKTVFFAESVHFFSYFVSDAPFVPEKQKDAARRPIAQVAQRVAIRVTTTAADARMMAVTMNSMAILLSVFSGAPPPVDIPTIPQGVPNLCGMSFLTSFLSFLMHRFAFMT